MRRTSFLLLTLLFPTGFALAQDTGTSEAPAAPSQSSPTAASEAAPEVPAESAPAARERKDAPEMETLISGKFAHGGFVSPVVMYSRVLDEDAFFFGVRAGWIGNHRFVVGGSIVGMMSEVLAPPGAPNGGENLQVNFGYGGAWLEYILFPHKSVHASIGTLIGGGKVAYTLMDEGDEDGGEDRDVALDGIFVIEPAVFLEANVLSFLRVAVGVGYRHVKDVELEGLSDDDFSGFNGSVMLKFGAF